MLLNTETDITVWHSPFNIHHDSWFLGRYSSNCKCNGNIACYVIDAIPTLWSIILSFFQLYNVMYFVSNVFFLLFLAFDFCRFCVVIRFFHPCHNGQWPPTSKDFLYRRFYPLHLFFYLNSWEKASIFPFECSVLNKGTTGTIFIMSLVWRGPWLGIEPGTSRTLSQFSTTRLSRRR